MSKRVDSLNVLRVGLIFVILCCHSGDFLPERLGFYVGPATGYALQLFFMISGFCSLLSCWKKGDQKTIPYFWAKLKKVYPIHFICFVLAFAPALYQVYSAGHEPWLGEMASKAVANLLLVQSWIPNQEYIFSYNGVSWFLSSLMFCYLVTPATVRLLKKYDMTRYGILLLLVALIVHYIYRCTYSYFGNGYGFCYTNVFPPFRFIEYFAGMAMGLAYLQKKENGGIQRNSLVQVGVLVLFLFCIYVSAHVEIAGNRSHDDEFMFCDAVLMYGLCMFEGSISDIGRFKPFEWLAANMLPFYMFHSLAFRYVRKLFYAPDGFTVWPCLPIWLAVVVFLLLVVAGYSKITGRRTDSTP